MGPDEVGRRWDEGAVSADDVVEAYLLELADPVRGPAVYEWLNREALEARRERVQQVTVLVQQIRACQDEGRRAELMGRLEELQG